MLKKTIEKRLNLQINREMYSAHLYYAMAAYFESINLGGFTNWMRVQALEELSHTDRLFKYIGDRGGRVTMEAIEAPPAEWKTSLNVLEHTYEHECAVSESINECLTLAQKQNDHATQVFLQWFVSEQIEEEASADAVVQKLKLIGKDTGGLYLLDAELAQRVFVPPQP